MRGVARRFGSKTVLDGLDWEVGQGQVVGLLGRNGAGKSTVMEFDRDGMHAVLPTAAALAVSLTIVLALRRYRSVLRAPFALPAGRLD